MSVDKLLIRATLVGLIVLKIRGDVAFAQEPVTIEDAPIPVAPSGQLNVTLEQLGYGNDEFNKDGDARTYRIELPGNFEISPTGNHFDLVTSYILETLDQPASLQLGMNERPLSTVPLTQANVVSNTVRVDLPAGILQGGRNFITIDLETGRTCDVPGATVKTLVENTSTLSFGYEQRPYHADLALYPFPFAEKSLLQIPVLIVLPDSPTSDDLSVAATVGAGLVRAAGEAVDISAVPGDEVKAESLANSHLIVIGQPNNNSMLSELELPVAIDNKVLKSGHGILEEIVSPWNKFRLALVVSGLDAEGVRKAGSALNRQAHFLGMRGPVAVVLDLLPLPEKDAAHEISITLESLGYQDEIAYGSTPQTYNYWFELPPGWQLTETPSFVLKFNHADVLDPYQSVIDVSLNELPVGSTLLDKTNTAQGELNVSLLPTDLLRTGPNRIQVVVEMSLLNGDKCQDEDNKRAWTVISNDSEIFLPYNAVKQKPNLSYFPYPFSQNSGFDQTLIILPDQSSPALFNDAIQLAAQMGRPSRPENILPRLVFAAEVTEDMRKNHHLILLGLPTQNVSLQEVNSYLPQAFVLGGNTLQPMAMDNVAFALDAGRDAGLLQIITSPWNENYSLLAISGTTEKGYQLTFQPLLETPWLLNGNVAVVEPAVTPDAEGTDKLNVFATFARSSTVLDSEASLEESDSSNSQEDLFLLAKRWWK